ncbi:mechanosensitive ion channel protein MscS [Coraliomargarita sinensis]|uniref:Mechanosensitive ion channel protein MscS n=1 Tax=Coraliomargarita sinensis TaxID=2174842 RepID=A0A317ZHM5_9BACT|nr:mechanosensitive ion channel domain-containing protein [Coraliomargarita sinensis]PXA04482.1 mechanosensitive ion channel protein MscS [Coraliomargarita sinensis]
MPSPYELIYIASVLVVGLVLYRVIVFVIDQTQARSIARLKYFSFTDITAGPAAPEGAPIEKQRSSALESVDNQFSIIRRTFFSVFFVVWMGFAFFPFLGKFSAGVISVLGAGGAVLIGIAARPLLENLIAGYVVTFSKQFRRGHTVMLDGEYGTIEDITPTHTKVKLWDWRRYLIPNSQMLTKEVLHYSSKDGYIWARLKFHVDYDTDIAQLREVAISAAKESEHLAGDEDPQLWIMNMQMQTIECWLAMWVDSPLNAWLIRVEVAEKLIGAFKREGIRTHSFDLHSDSGQMPAQASDSRIDSAMR